MNESQDSRSIPGAGGDQRSAFEAAAEIALGSGGEGSGEPASFRGEMANVADWARREGALISDAEIDRLELVSNSTSEHEVFYREADDRAVKRTWPGVYGQIPAPDAGKLGRRNATPSEYLRRMALQIAVFGSDLRLEGVTISEKPSLVIGEPPGQPSFVISQHWYERSGIATNEVIAALMEREGFREVPVSYFGWYRDADGIVVVDAKPDNFILTAAGLIPIDLQLAVFTGEQMREAGLGV